MYPQKVVVLLEATPFTGGVLWSGLLQSETYKIIPVRRGCAVALRDIGGWGRDYPRAPGACELERIAGTAAYGLAAIRNL